MKFRSPLPEGSDPIRLSTTEGGATALVGTDWRELPESLHREALAAGCECDQAVIRNPSYQRPAPGTNGKEPDQILREKLVEMLSRNKDGDFTAANMPNLSVLSGLAGFKVEKDVAYKIFGDLQAEAAAGGLE